MQLSTLTGRLKKIVLLVLMVGCVSCATLSQTDPFESTNRKIYKFNKKLDEVILRPVTVVYDTYVPEVVDNRIDAFLSNLNDVTVVINGALQGQIVQAMQDTARLCINTTIGIAGLFDVATKLGLYKHHEDFGQTLAVWGVESGPYIMLPILGPSTLRDLPGELVDPITDTVLINPVAKKRHWDWLPTNGTLFSLNTINTRQSLMDQESFLEAAEDEYAYLRDVYLQNRRYKIYNGMLPDEEEEEELFEDEDLDDLEDLEEDLTDEEIDDLI